MVVALVAFALTVSLASRVFHATTYDTATLHSSSAIEKIQHRDMDGVEWGPATAQLIVLWVTEAAVIPENGEHVHVRLHDTSLYNRPPPLS